MSSHFLSPLKFLALTFLDYGSSSNNWVFVDLLTKSIFGLTSSIPAGSLPGPFLVAVPLCSLDSHWCRIYSIRLIWKVWFLFFLPNCQCSVHPSLYNIWQICVPQRINGCKHLFYGQMFKATELEEVGFEPSSRWLESTSSSHYNISKWKKEHL